MYFVFTRTRLGMMIRAGATNREMVQSLGIDIKFLYRVVFAAGVAIAVLAGMVAAPMSAVYPGMGNSVLIICFVVVVIGGIGSIRGALLAALLVGLVDTFGKVLLAAGRRRAGLRADGADPAVEARRPVQGDLNHERRSTISQGGLRRRLLRGTGAAAAGHRQLRRRPGQQDHDLRDLRAEPRAAGGRHRPGVLRPGRLLRHRRLCGGAALAPRRGGWAGLAAAGLHGRPRRCMRWQSAR